MKIVAVAVLAACTTAPPSPTTPSPPDASIDAPVVVEVPPAATGRVLGVGGYFACARTADARVSCWGGTQFDYHLATPTPVAGVANVVGVAVGQYDACAWHRDGTATCWAFLGKDHAAAKVTGLGEVVQLVAGIGPICARKKSGDVACWSRDLRAPEGKVLPPVFTPIELHDAIDLAVAGSTFCARRLGGAVSCWDADKGDKPVDVAAAKHATFVGGGILGSSTQSIGRFAAILPDHSVIGWSVDGKPWKVPALPADLTQLALGYAGGCGLGAEVTCWTVDYQGKASPAKPLPNSAGATDVAMGWILSCLTRDRGVACWGIVDALGTDTSYLQRTPLEVPALEGVVALAPLKDEWCAKTSANKVRCFGVDPAVEKAVPASKLAPARLTSWSGGQFRHAFSCWRAGASVKCHAHYSGRRGEDEDYDMFDLDKELAAFGPIRDVMFHDTILYVLTESGVVKGQDQVGGGAWRDHATGATALSLGLRNDGVHEEDCALAASGKVTCWETLEPTKQRTLLEDGAQLAHLDGTTCVVRKTGKVACWGHRDLMGTGSGSNTRVPLATPGVVL